MAKFAQTRALGGDLEGITYDPSERQPIRRARGPRDHLRGRPESFVIRRRFTIDRSFEGDRIFLERGGDGIEGLTFVPDPDHREGGRFFAVNQFDPPALVELSLPLRTSRERFEKARIVLLIGRVAPAFRCTCGAPNSRAFLIPSALWRSVYVVAKPEIARRRCEFPESCKRGSRCCPMGQS